MSEPARVLRGVTQAADGSSVEVRAEEFPPEPTPGHDDWSCAVRCPYLFASDKRIAGVDAAQALELTEFFLRRVFADRGVRDVEAKDVGPGNG